MDQHIHRPIIKVPFERLSQKFRRSQKQVLKSLSTTATELKEAQTCASQEALINLLTAAENKLTELRSLVEEDCTQELECVDQLEARMKFVQRLRSSSDEAHSISLEGNGSLPMASADTRNSEGTAHSRKRPAQDACSHTMETKMKGDGRGGLRDMDLLLNRMIADSLLHHGMVTSARSFCEESKLDGTLVDLAVYERIHIVCASIRSRTLDAALLWTRDHGSRLRRLDSKLEFQLRKRQFLELVRSGLKQDALSFACEHLSPQIGEFKIEIHECMGTLAITDEIPEDNVSEREYPPALRDYAKLFAVECWDELAMMFEHEARRVYGVSSCCSSLDLVVQSGLSVLKTPHCFDDDQRSIQCPVCSDQGRVLAQGLPQSHQSHSYLLCRTTSVRMDHHNPPLALPNGSIYSTHFLTQMANENNGKVTCLRTGEVFEFDQAQDVYII